LNFPRVRDVVSSKALQNSMSIRGSYHGSASAQPCGSRGSLLGEALSSQHIEEFWGEKLTLSPTSSRLDEGFSGSPMDEDEDLLGPPQTLKALESAVQTFSYTLEELVESAYVFFERQKAPVVVSSGPRGTRWNRQPVLPRVVNTDALHWNPMYTNGGEEGHAFTLFHQREKVATIEVTNSRVVVVHATYSPAALDAGLIHPSTRLVFERTHPQQLADLLDEVAGDDDQLYLPVGEILLGKSLDRVPLRVLNKEHHSSTEARRVWLETRSFLRSMQRHVVRGIESQNQSEFLRVGATEIPNSKLDMML
jgi:hypothetical protein